MDSQFDCQSPSMCSPAQAKRDYIENKVHIVFIVVPIGPAILLPNLHIRAIVLAYELADVKEMFLQMRGTHRTMSDEPFEIVDPSGLTDADWVEINKLKAAYASGEERALDKAMGELANKHPIRYLAVLAAFFPDMTRHSIDSRMADPGVKEEDIRELSAVGMLAPSPGRERNTLSHRYCPERDGDNSLRAHQRE
jgi:hypothetical protein